MANIVIANNGNPTLIPATYDPDTGEQLTPEIPADPAITYTDANGVQTVIQPATSTGFALPPSNKVTGS